MIVSIELALAIFAGISLVFQIMVGAFFYGKLTQKVESYHAQNRADIVRIEAKIDNRNGRYGRIPVS